MPPYARLNQQTRARDLAGLQQTLADEIVPYQDADPAGEEGWRLRVIPNLWTTWFSTTDPMDPAIARALLEAQPVGVPGVDLGKSLGMIVRKHPPLHALLPLVLPHVTSVFDSAQALREALEMGVTQAVQALATPAQVQADRGSVVWFAAKNAPRSDLIALLLPLVDLAEVVTHHAGTQWEAWDRLAELAPSDLRDGWIHDHPGQLPLAEARQRAEVRQAALREHPVSPRSRPRFRA